MANKFHPIFLPFERLFAPGCDLGALYRCILLRFVQSYMFFTLFILCHILTIFTHFNLHQFLSYNITPCGIFLIPDDVVDRHAFRLLRAWGDFHARSRFTRSTIPEEKWGTTRV